MNTNVAPPRLCTSTQEQVHYKGTCVIVVVVVVVVDVVDVVVVVSIPIAHNDQEVE